MNRFSFILLLFFTIVFNSYSQWINEIIPPLKLNSGEKKTFLISDLFYSENYDKIIFYTDDSLKVLYDPEIGEVELTSLKNSEGYSILSLFFYDKPFHILCKTEFKQTIFFSFNPKKKIKGVNLFGSFNGWNRENLPMTDDDGDGIYSIGVKLNPGRYEYKFYIDGEEIIDPLNSNSIPNGLGGWNSVIVVKPIHTDKSYLHLIDYSYNEMHSQFTFYYETETPEHFEVISLLDNELVTNSEFENKVLIEIPLGDLRGFKTLRVAINENGNASNLQTIFLKDGRPLSNQDTTWFDAIIYSIMVDRFYDGDSTNNIPVQHPELLHKANYFGGDLQGIIDKLEDGYFNSLGVNTLWLSPVIDNTPNAYREYPEPHRYYTGYHGYWPVHPTKVEERFGDMALLKKLINTAHSNGIKILLDYVANHIHIEHPFWEEHRDWFGNLELPDGRKNLRLWDEYRLTTWFEPFMPKFDYENSDEALEVMTDNAIWWLKETGADGFRHDAVKHVPNKFWRLLTKKIKFELNIPGKRIYYQVGETFDSYELVSSYVNNGQLDAQFNFILYDTAIPTFTDTNASFIALDQQIQKTFDVYGVNNLMGNVMDSHDKVRFMAYADGDVSLNNGNAVEIGWKNPPIVDDPESYEKLKLYLAYMMTIPGIPVVYYGDEIGMTGAGDPDNRRMMRFDKEVTEWEKETLSDVKEIIKVRNEHSALRYGDFQTLLVDKDIYAYLRSDFNERVLVILNKSDKEKKIDIQLPDIYNFKKADDVVSEKEFALTENKLSIEVNSLDYLILKLD